MINSDSNDTFERSRTSHSQPSSHLLELLLLQSCCVARRVTLSVQIHLHELLNGQLTSGRVLKLVQSEGEEEEDTTESIC